MSVLSIIRWARQQRTGDRTAKAVLLVIASHADRDGIATLSYRTIAAEAEIHESTVRKDAVPVLVAAGAVEFDPGRGRGKSQYRVLVGNVVRGLDPARPKTRYAGANPAQPDLYSAGPEPRTTSPDSAGPGERCAGLGTRSADRRASDQHRQSHEVEEEEEKKGAPSSPPARAPRERAHARGGGGERVPAAELNRTAAGGRAFVIVSTWAEHQPGLTTSARRNLSRAVDQLLAQRADATLIPEALDHAHSGPFRNPVAALPYAYEDVRRAHRPPPPTTAVQLAASNGRVPTTTQRVNGALAHLDPEEP